MMRILSSEACALYQSKSGVRHVCMQFEGQRIVCISKHWWVQQSYPQSVKGLLLFLCPGKGCFLLSGLWLLPLLTGTMSDQEVIQRPGNPGVVLDKVAVVSSKPEEGSDIFDCLRYWPSSDGFSLFLVRLYAILRYDMAQVGYTGSHEFAFSGLVRTSIYIFLKGVSLIIPQKASTSSLFADVTRRKQSRKRSTPTPA